MTNATVKPEEQLNSGSLDKLPEVTTYPQMPAVKTPKQSGKLDVFFNTEDFEEAQRKAKMIAASKFIPEQFRGNIGDCVIALDMAQRMGVSPIMVLQEMYIVHGKPSFSSKFIIAIINQSGKFAGPLQFERTQDSCKAWAVDKLTGEQVDGITVTIDMAQKEGWYSKKGSKWPNMPEVMLMYRAASFFGKMYCSDLMMGMQSVEEQHDIIDITPEYGESDNVNTDELNASLKK